MNPAALAEALARLPHGPEFRFVDRLLELDPGKSGAGEYRVRGDQPFLRGHFPGDPVFPGVLMIEGMAQTAGVLCIAGGTKGFSKQVFFLTIDKAKFRKLVRPGDTIEYHMTKKAQRKNMWWYIGIAKVAGETVAEAEVGAMIVDS